MKTLYLDLGMGAAGDMLTAALLELIPEAEREPLLNAMQIPGVIFRVEKCEKCGITGTHVSVLVHGEEEGAHTHTHAHGHEHEHEHTHRTAADIRHLVTEHLNVPEAVRESVLAVYELLAAAESRVHGVPVNEIHFHEVGTMDALADIAAVCLLLHRLSPDEIVASPVHVGAGTVHCAHGILPVPAPATAYLLRDVPIYGGRIRSELCTPTGAALLRHFVMRFGDMPLFRPAAIGYGMGRKDFDTANCVRAILGETQTDADTMIELRCNLDDMTAEEIAFACERLLEAGAPEVYTVPVGMKKSRPGTMLCVLCRPEVREQMTALALRYTTTLGVRWHTVQRTVLERTVGTVETSFGEVRKKRASGSGVTREKYEYDDLARIARERNLTLGEVRAQIEKEEKP